MKRKVLVFSYKLDSTWNSLKQFEIPGKRVFYTLKFEFYF